MKTWNSKDIAEIIGILAIIGSLVFVGLELQQNSAIARMEAHSEFVSALSESTTAIAQNPQLSQLVWDTTVGTKSVEELTGGERIQIRNLYQGNVSIWYGLYQSIQEGILDEKYMENIATAGLHDSDAFRFLWPGLRNNFSAEFVEFFESLPWNNPE